MGFEFLRKRQLINAQSPDRPHDEKKLEILKKKQISPGGEYAKSGVYQATVVLESDKRKAHPVSVVIKDYASKNASAFRRGLDSVAFSDIPGIYSGMKKDGLKVPQTLRFDTKQALTIMTDLNSSERIALSAGNESTIQKERKIEEIPNFDAVARDLLAEAIAAGRKGYFVPHDSYYLLIPRGEGKVTDFVIGDFDIVRKSLPQYQYQQAGVNLKHAHHFLSEFCDSWLVPERKKEYLESLDRAFKEVKTELNEAEQAVLTSSN